MLTCRCEQCVYSAYMRVCHCISLQKKAQVLVVGVCACMCMHKLVLVLQTLPPTRMSAIISGLERVA